MLQGLFAPARPARACACSPLTGDYGVPPSRCVPDSYAPSAKEARVCEILGEQMAAVDALYRESRPPRPALALFAGFECFRRWPALRGPEDE
jgi:hypothetical protein